MFCFPLALHRFIVTILLSSYDGQHILEIHQKTNVDTNRWKTCSTWYLARHGRRHSPPMTQRALGLIHPPVARRRPERVEIRLPPLTWIRLSEFHPFFRSVKFRWVISEFRCLSWAQGSSPLDPFSLQRIINFWTCFSSISNECRFPVGFYLW